MLDFANCRQNLLGILHSLVSLAGLGGLKPTRTLPRDSTRLSAILYPALILNSWLPSEATTNNLSLLSSFLDVGYAYRQYCHPSWKAPFLAVVLVTLGLQEIQCN
jgi:hypothetical protein